MYFVYILSNKRNRTLYIGFTSDLKRRVWEHKHKSVKGFTEKYEVDKLIYFESTDSKDAALLREKQMKKWNRSWKIKLISSLNPDWADLYNTI